MKTVNISVRNLVEFILRSGDIDERRGRGGSVEAMLEGARIHRAIQQAAGSDYSAEVSMREETDLGNDITLVIEGRADGVIDKDGYITIDEIKGMYLDVLKLAEPVEVHLAQAKCYAYIWAKQHGLEQISVRMTYVGIEDRKIKLFELDYDLAELSEWFSSLIEKYRPWAEFLATWRNLRDDTIKSLDFPYEYRRGQKELAADVYRTIYHQKKLFLEAPTGTGKTLATLYPSIKAAGEGLISYIFFLTAKNIGARAAADALELLREDGGLRLKSVSLLGKERSCINEVPKCNPDACEYAKGHFDRVNEVLYELLTSKDAFTREEIAGAAYRGNVCPYALARDLTEFSDCVICDYNYVFDPGVALRHFFGEGKRTGDYLFLVDEAHNLVERARDMYSADLSLMNLRHIRSLIRGTDRRLTSYMTSLIGLMQSLDEALKESGAKYQLLSGIYEVEDAASRLAGRFLELMQERRHTAEAPDGAGSNDGQGVLPGINAIEKAESAVDIKNKPADNERFSDEVLEFYFSLAGFVEICDRLDQRYRVYTERNERGDMRLRLLCVDPSHNLSEYLAYGRASVFFSATLLPVGYYMDLLAGSRDNYSVYASSVFDPDKLGVFIDTDVTSRYARRSEEEYRKIAVAIHEAVECRRGNYMVFFPSYSFLESVYREYESLFYDSGELPVCQTQDMTEEDRAEFLKGFDSGAAVTGFCVMGGLFAEGIDLTGESLIGAIIVGTGLPQISNEKDILKKYFDENGNDGYDYAMKIPGMNKVLQAAGRVIRTEEDTGVIILMDERFDKADHRRMYPREWLNITKITGCDFDSVRKFWSRNGR